MTGSAKTIPQLREPQSMATLQRQFAYTLLGKKPSAGLSMNSHAVQLYADSVIGNLEGVLAAGFPVTRQYVGVACFAELARRFIQSNLPRSAKLAKFGQGFSEFVGAQHELRAWPCLRSLVELEWQRKCLLVAADRPKAEQISCPDAELLAAPYAKLFTSRYDVVRLIYWHDNRVGDGPDLQPFADLKRWLLVRRGNQIDMCDCDATTAALFVAAETGGLSDEIERLAGSVGVGTVSERLSRLIAAGIVISQAVFTNSSSCFDKG